VIAVAIISLLLMCGGLLAGVVVDRRRQHRDVETVELRFGSDVSESAVWGVLGSMAGLPLGTQLTLEVVGDADGIRHYLRAGRGTIEIVRAHLRGLLPGVRLEPVESEAPVVWQMAARVRFSGAHPLLRSDRHSETAASLLGALSGLRGDERVLVRWTLQPARGPYLSERSAQGGSDGLLMRLLHEQPIDPSQLRALHQKYAGPVLTGWAVIAVTARGEALPMNLMTRVVVVFRTRTGLRGHPVVRYCRSGRVQRFVERVPPRSGSRFSPAELMGLLAWPLDGPRVPGLVLSAAPQLMPSPRIPSRGGVVWAHSTWPGLEGRPIASPLLGLRSHMVAAGPSGTGKSSMMATIAAAHIAANRGLMLLDGKGDLAEQTLGLIPDHRRDEVIVLQPGREGPVPGLRVFGDGADPELSGDLILGVFRSIFIDSWGVRSDKWLRAGLVTLAHDKTAALGSLPFLFSSESFRRRLVGQLTDPLLKATWAEFEALSPEARAHQLGSPLQKINELVGRRVVRSVVAQPEPKWDMHEVLRKGQVVIISLSPGLVGAPASRLLAALVVHELMLAVQARARVPAEKRRPYYVMVDEPKVFTDIDLPLDSLFELARGLEVSLAISAQSLTALPTELAHAALTNAATLVAFRQNHDDAKLLAKELPGVSAEELQALGKFEIAARIGLGPGDVSPPVTGRTLPPPEPISDPEEVRRESAARYGTDPEEVDRALSERHGLSDQAASGIVGEETPVRRRRRQAS
jgi:hypothetical protein